MFPFGSLFTQVPLMILATAYMLYLGVYAVGKTKEYVAENQQESKELTLSTNTSSLNNNTYYFKASNEVKQDITTVNKITTSHCRSFICIEYSDPETDLVSRFKSYNLFSRPPPSLG